MDTPEFIPSVELVALHERFREVKHSINNSLAVIMALSELSQRNPVHYEKLTKAVLSRGPDIVSQLQDFQQALLGKIKPGSSMASPPTSGIF
ncbi:MAG: hypothetical protein QOD99_3012 [Chthoniobacter sp.]|jgi:two-component sensor histidine kinase|nr:hypothetical protein [Chthoniobacter sp.]